MVTTETEVLTERPEVQQRPGWETHPQRPEASSETDPPEAGPQTPVWTDRGGMWEARAMGGMREW